MLVTMRTPIPDLEMTKVDVLPGFVCRRCARCCKGKVIVVYADDLKRLRSLEKEGFVEKTTDLENEATGASYKMKMAGGNCVLLEGDSCAHYDLRPDTCRRHSFLVTNNNLLVASTCLGVDWRTSQGHREFAALSNNISKKIDSFLKKVGGSKIVRKKRMSASSHKSQ